MTKQNQELKKKSYKDNLYKGVRSVSVCVTFTRVTIKTDTG